MTDKEKTTYTNEQLLKTVKWFITLIEKSVNSNDDYCQNVCPLRDKFDCCDAISHNEIFLNDDYETFEECDYPLCMKLRVKYFVEKAND